jgi:hypothetical protein
MVAESGGEHKEAAQRYTQALIVLIRCSRAYRALPLVSLSLKAETMAPSDVRKYSIQTSNLFNILGPMTT